ncbi:McrA protein [Bacillus toyonensis]|uniref:MrcB family domain-containing protein n=1 Tax=Bacillus toyonensis TaxID=155322 RepID=UPI000BFC3A12|nr:DUF3578 domain-containing protein [Bacillus toyonensis]PHF83539.1 McrA protein [Bacillus toyonensis]
MNKSYNEVVGSMIRKLRDSQGVSLRDLAAELSVTYPGLSRMENGEQKIDMDFLMKVARYFEVSVNSLLNEEEEVFNQPSYPPIISMPRVGGLEIKTKLEYVLKNYLTARGQDFKGHSMGNHVRNEITKTLEEEVPLDKKRYLVTGSVGKGQWAEIAWTSIFIRNITTTATKGYYIVYLFKADMTGFYISLNQGYTHFQEKYSTKEARKKIKRTAELVRDQINTLPDHLRETEINLASKNDLGKGYEQGHIYGRYYSFESLPSSEEIISDLQHLLLAYQEVEKLMNGRSTKQFNDYLLLEDDNEFLEGNEQETKYQEKVNDFVTINETAKDFEDDEGPRERPEPKVDKGGRKRWPRDAKIAAAALKLSGYKCSYDEKHKTFISKVTGMPFMELHHLVPMSLQDNIIKDLDRVVNVKSLCCQCHRAIHHGEDEMKSMMVEKLYKDSRDELEEVGIEITLSDLKKAYGIKE